MKRAILVARAPEPLRIHLQLNSQSYTTFFEMRQAIKQYLKARKGFKLKEREDYPMDVDFVHKASRKGKGKGNDKGKGKPKGKGKQFEKGKRCWARQIESRNVPRNVQKLARRCETDKIGDVNWIMMIQQPNDGQTITVGHED